MAVDPATCRLVAFEPERRARWEWPLPEPWYWIVEQARTSGFLAGLEDRINDFDFDLEHGPRPGRVMFRLPQQDRGAVRFNDAKVDKRGRLFTGTMDLRGEQLLGRLYRLDPDGTTHTLEDLYTIPNGPAVTGDGHVLYQADSARRTVYAFDLHPDGSLDNRRIHLTFAEADGNPDGMTCDRDDGLWIAHWGTGRISRFLPDGRRDRMFNLPVRGTTSLTFFGRDLDRLAVTTAARCAPRTFRTGAIFAIDPGVPGVPANLFGHNSQGTPTPY